jgi:hypothetical protein
VSRCSYLFIPTNPRPVGGAYNCGARAITSIVGWSSAPRSEQQLCQLRGLNIKSWIAKSGMGEPKTGSGSHSPTSGPKSSSGRQRIISSCLTCRRRKVKCDHVHPVCGACQRGSHVCTWTEQVQTPTVAGRISKSSATGGGKIAKNSDVQSRLDRLELLLEKAVAGQGQVPQTSVRSSADFDRKDRQTQSIPSPNSQMSNGQGMAADDGDGVLLLDEGRSQFVSSLHFALLADEVRTCAVLWLWLGPRLLPEGWYLAGARSRLRFTS